MATSRFLIPALFLGCACAQADDFHPLMDVAKASWPGKNHIAVVADYAASLGEITELADAAGSGMVITVLDTHGERNLQGVHRMVVNRIKPDYVVLLRHDRTLREGALETTWMVGQIAGAGIATIGTSAMAIRQGAVFAVGSGTGNDLLVTDEIKGSVHVTLPVRDSFRPQAALRSVEGRAEVRRLDLHAAR